jgi:hypothetical protein
LEDIGQVTFTTVLTILVLGHEDTSTTSGVRALTTKTGDLTRFIDLVVLEDSELDLGTLVLDLLGGSVGLLLSLLTTTEEFSVKVESRVVLDTVEGKSFRVLKRLTSERKTLEFSIDTFFFTKYVKKNSSRITTCPNL